MTREEAERALGIMRARVNYLRDQEQRHAELLQAQYADMLKTAAAVEGEKGTDPPEGEL